MKNKKEKLINKMEKQFNKAFNLLGTATNMKDNHKIYDLLFECKQIYIFLKENENE